MEEIVVLAGLLGVVFLFFWGVIVFLEGLVNKKKDKGKTGERNKAAGENVVPVIVASIAAYEEEEGVVRRERVKYAQGRVRGISWWRVSSRQK